MEEKNEGPTKHVLKVVLIGEGGVGKSSLLQRFSTNHFTFKQPHTVGVECVKVKIDDATLQIWDTAGQERFRSLRTPFYRGADICILVFSVNDLQSFEKLSFWYNEFLQHSSAIDEPLNFPFVIIGNKSEGPSLTTLTRHSDNDLITDDDDHKMQQTAQQNGSISPPEKRVVTREQAERWASEGGRLFPYIETSAKDGTNVIEAFKTGLRSWKNLRGSVEIGVAVGGAGGTHFRHLNSHQNSTHQNVLPTIRLEDIVDSADHPVVKNKRKKLCSFI